MTMTQIIMIVAIAAAIIAALAARGTGPRVTQIDRVTRKRKSEGDER